MTGFWFHYGCAVIVLLVAAYVFGPWRRKW